MIRRCIKTMFAKINDLITDRISRNNLKMFLFLVSVLTVCSLLYYYFTRTLKYWESRNIPGPKPLPFFGNLLDSTLRRKNIAIVFKEIYEAFPNEKVVGVYRMTTPGLLIRDLEIAKHIFIKDFDNFSDRGVSFSEIGLGNNLFHSDTDKWRVLRNRFTPIFTSGKLKHMMYLLEERGNQFIDYLEDKCETATEFNVHSMLEKFTMSSITACAFGLEVDANSDKMEYLEKLDKMLTSPSFIDELDMMYPGILKKLNLEIFPKKVTAFFVDLVTSVINQRNGEPSNRKDFMDLILELRQNRQLQGTRRSDNETHFALELTDDIIAAQAFVFYAGGYETSASTMAFMMYELAKNPDVQQKLIAEVDEVLKKHDGKVTYETINDLHYMEKVFDETLRLYPIVEPLQRRAQTDYQLPGTNITVKKGQMVLVSGMGIHRDAKYYPDPEKFDPERFSPDIANNRHSCAYIPFGTGPRNCIGMRFAKVQSRMCLLKFFSKFRVALSSRTPKVMKFVAKRFILAAEGGVHLNVVPRKY